MSESETQPFEQASASGVAVSGFLHLPPNPSGDALVLTHGAGANCQSPLLVALANAFSHSGLTVLRCNLPFRQRRPHGPPGRGSAEGDQQGLQLAVEAMQKQMHGRVFLGGHSYGGRQASILASAQPELIDRLLLLSYPLYPPQRHDQPRTAHFPDLHTPALFVHGARDKVAPTGELTAALKLIPAPTQLLTIERAGHELATARTLKDVTTAIVEAFWMFCYGKDRRI